MDTIHLIALCYRHQRDENDADLLVDEDPIGLAEERGETDANLRLSLSRL
jgi:hypothetical protein